MTKSRRSKLSPTKLPRQARSRATVEAILKATADILAKHGYARLTTNGIAERAGVNIASLYQYFPSKQAIVAELRRRHGIEQRAAVGGCWPSATARIFERPWMRWSRWSSPPI